MQTIPRIPTALLACALAAAPAAAQQFTTAVITRNLQRPTGIATDAAGTLWLTEVPQPGIRNGSNQVSRLDNNGANQTVLVSGEPEPVNIALGPNGDQYWTCRSAGVIQHWANNTRTTLLSNLASPTGIAVGNDGTVYFTEVPTPGQNGMNGGRNRVLSWTAAGGIQVISSGEPEPVDVAVDDQDNLCWTCKSAGVILCRDAATQTIRKLLSGLEQPTGLDVDRHGRLWFSELPTPGTSGNNGGRNRVSRFDPATRTLRVVDFGDPEPRDVAVAPDGSHVYWTCSSAGVVVRADAAGMPVTLTANGPATIGQAVPLLLSAPGHAGEPYLAASSFGLGPVEFAGHVIALEPDMLVAASIGGICAPGAFAGYLGMFDASGHASAAIVLPPLPALRGVVLHTAYLVLDMHMSVIADVSETLRLELQ